MLQNETGEKTMRDLKHLIYFENLLQEANNALVKQACASDLAHRAAQILTLRPIT